MHVSYRTVATSFRPRWKTAIAIAHDHWHTIEASQVHSCPTPNFRLQLGVGHETPNPLRKAQVRVDPSGLIFLLKPQAHKALASAVVIWGEGVGKSVLLAKTSHRGNRR